MERAKLDSTKKTGAVNARSGRAPVKKAERKPKAEIEQKANVLRMAILFKGIDKVDPVV